MEERPVSLVDAGSAFRHDGWAFGARGGYTPFPSRNGNVVESEDDSLSGAHGVRSSVEAVSRTTDPARIALTTHGEAIIDAPRSALEMKQLALAPTLDTLEEDLIGRDSETFTVGA